MRTIKFRGKRLDNQQWVYGGISIFEGEATIYDENDMTNTPYEVDINTVGQFTEMKNENDEEIYEGDIVKVGGLIEIVRYIDGILCCYNERIYGFHERLEIETEDLIVSETDYFIPYDVIGNIYENYEILQ